MNNSSSSHVRRRWIALPFTCVSTHGLRRKFLSAAAFLLMCSAQLIASEFRSFDLDGGDAGLTLKHFAQQARLDIVFDPQSVAGVQTREVVGLFLPKVALERMLNGTPLVFKQDLETGAVAVTRSKDPPEDLETQSRTQSTELQIEEETEMKSKNNKWLKTLATVLTLGMTSIPSQLNAQEEETIYELSPFTIRDDETVGYLATTTLAGTRIKSNLKDLAAAISVYTLEFIEDTASTDITDLLVYAVGVEVDGMNGNFTGATPSGNFDTFDFNNLSLGHQTSTRVRGLANADRTRNYFGSIIPLDSYNVGRVVVNRGANNILFGLGSPAGIINQNLAQPLSAEKNRLRIRTDQYGSIRGSFDVNRVLIEDKVNIRLMGLHSDQRYQQDPAYTKTQRIYGAVDFHLTKTTVLKVNAEFGDMISAPPMNAPPRDRFTNWWKPEVGQPTLPLGLDFRDRDFLNIDGTPIVSGTAQIGLFENSVPILGLRPIWNRPLPRANLDLAPYDALRPNRQRAFQPMFTTLNAESRRIRLRPTQTGVEGITLEDGFVQSPQIHDVSVFNYREDTLGGRNNLRWNDIEAYNLSLQQTFFDGNAGIELSYDSQQFGHGSFNFLAGGWRSTISMDLNEGYPDGAPNPNFGRAFLSGFPSFLERENSRESERALIYFNFDAEEHWGGFGKWLGQHILTGLYEKSTTRELGYGGPGFSLDPSYGEAVGIVPTQIRYGGQLKLGFGQYLVGSVDNFIGTSSPAGANLRKPSDTFEYPSSLTMVNISPVDRSFVRQEYPVLNWRDNKEAFTIGSSLNALEVDSLVVALQSKFLSDHLITTMGWRKDEDNRWVADSLNGTEFRNSLGTHDLSGLVLDEDDLFPGEGDETFSWGAVYHIPDALLGENSGLDLSLYYNASENFNPNLKIRKPIAERFGEEFPAPFGESLDYGATIGLYDGKFIVKAGWFETSEKSAVDRGPSGPYGWYFSTLPRNVYANNSLAEIQAAGFDAALPSEGVQIAYNYQFVSDPEDPGYLTLETGGESASPIGDVTHTISKGFELELIYNPNRNLRLFLNLAKQKAIRTGIAQTGGAEMERLFALWNKPEILRLRRQPPSSSTQDISNYIEFRVLQQIAEIRSQITENGRKSPALRDWRANLGGNYSFDNDTALKGWGIGGAMRWQDKPTIGYPIIDHPELGPIRNIDSPVYGAADTKVDTWVRYRRVIFDDKVNWTLQLNIRNLLDEDDLVDVNLNFAGLANIVRFTEGRRLILSSTFDF